jgi:hypothetical protein
MNIPSTVMVAFDFDKSDLVANRAGQLTEKQRRTLRPNALLYYWDKGAGKVAPIGRIVAWTIGLGLDLIALLELVALASLAILSFWVLSEARRGASLFLVLLAVGHALLWLISWRTRRRVRARPSKVSTTEGLIKLKPGTPQRPHLLRLNRRQFVLTDAQYEVLTSGQRCRLYFMGDRILSIELLNVHGM